MPTYGLSFDGFAAKTLTVIREEINASLREAFGSSIDLSDRSVFGQIVGILAERYAQLWELAEAVNSSQDPDKATGAALDALCTLTGTFRPQATYSTTIATLTGVPGTIVTSGGSVSTLSTGAEFVTSADATIIAVSAWASSTTYAVGNRVTNGGNVYQCVTAGTSAASGGPTSDDENIPDGVDTLVWTFVGEGTGVVDAVAHASSTGAVEAFARDLTQIGTTIAGWSGAINLLDADVGREIASDLELRLLREAELGGLGSSTISALRAKLLQLSDVKSATVFQNTGDVTDANGLPPHSVEALVLGPSVPTSAFDQSVCNLLLNNVAAGIQTYGTVVGSAFDTQGTSHVVKFSRPTEKQIYIYLDIAKDVTKYPANGDQLIKDAIVEWGDLTVTGQDAVPTGVAARVFDVAGVLEVRHIALSLTAISTPTTWTASTVYSSGNVVRNSGRVYRCTTGGTSAASGGPSTTGTGITDNTAVWEFLGATIPITLRQLATYDTTRIAVTSSNATP